MKTLYIGDVREGTTTRDRLHSLERLGHVVTPFNTQHYESTTRLISSIQCRFNPRLLLNRLNEDIRALARRAGPFDFVWVDKGVWIFSDTVQYLKQHAGTVIHFTPDPQIVYFRSHHFIESIPHYDHLVTTKDFEIDLYSQHGAHNVVQVTQSYCPVRYRHPLPSSQFTADIGFVGRCEEHYLQQLNRVSALDKVVVFGDQWRKPANRKMLASPLIVQPSVWREDYVAALASFKLSLGLLSKNYPEQHTTRTFEIPAAGTFMLAERTPEHTQFFDEGKEAEFFSGPDEMLSKARFYLDNDAARERIAAMGRMRCLSSGYDTDSVIKKILRLTDTAK